MAASSEPSAGGLTVLKATSKEAAAMHDALLPTESDSSIKRSAI
jgi:hypothetical protein